MKLIECLTSYRASRISWLVIVLTLFVGQLPRSVVLAETWADNTGKFKIDAEFVAIKGDNVVLKKANGSTVEVPLRRLDQAGQDLAKRLATKRTPAAAPAGGAPDEYLRGLIAAGEAGDYQKIWSALPSQYQQDVHDVIHSFADGMDSQLWSQVAGVLKKAVRVLKEKHEFILGLPQVALAGDPDKLGKVILPITDVLDATINSELSDLEKLKKFDSMTFAKGDGQKIAEKMKAASQAATELQKLVPVPAAIPGGAEAGTNPVTGLANVKASDVKITVISHAGDSAVLKMQVQDKPSKEEEWVRVDGKWLPKKMVDEWQTQVAKAKQWTAGEMKQQLAGVKAQVGFFVAPINLTLDQLQAAQTQDQFNQVINNLQQQFGGGAAPAGR